MSVEIAHAGESWTCGTMGGETLSFREGQSEHYEVGGRRGSRP